MSKPWPRHCTFYSKLLDVNFSLITKRFNKVGWNRHSRECLIEFSHRVLLCQKTDDFYFQFQRSSRSSSNMCSPHNGNDTRPSCSECVGSSNNFEWFQTCSTWWPNDRAQCWIIQQLFSPISKMLSCWIVRSWWLNSLALAIEQYVGSSNNFEQFETSSNFGSTNMATRQSSNGYPTLFWFI